MNSLFNIIYIIWALSEIFISRFLRSKAGDKKNQDKNSLALIWIIIIISMILAVEISIKLYLPISTLQFARNLGVVMIGTGVILRLLVISSLGNISPRMLRSDRGIN